MAITRYESYYGKIREQVEKIRNENEYSTNSLDFLIGIWINIIS